MAEVATETKEVPQEETSAVESVPETAAEEQTSVVTSQKLTKKERDIIRQIEYYFGDSNLNRDKFLLEEIGKDEGWVSFDILLTFKRLASISKDTAEIAAALAKSDAGLVVVSEDKQKIRRHPERPVPEFNEEVRKEIMTRTAYCKGFPLEVEMSDIIDFFNPYDKVVNITMRKYLDKPTKTYKFKGSVFVVFATKAQLEEFLAKDKIMYNDDRELITKSQETYMEEKKEERNMKTKKNKKEDDRAPIELPKGAVLKFEGQKEDTAREVIREAIEKYEADIAFIDYNRGDKIGHVRLSEANSAKLLMDKFTNAKIELNDKTELTFSVLTEEEDTEFLKKAVEQMKSRRNQQNRNRNSHHRHGGGHNNNRKRRGDNSSAGSDEPRAKHNKK